MAGSKEDKERRRDRARNYLLLPRHHLQHCLSSSLVTAEEEKVDLAQVNMRVEVRVKCNLIEVWTSSRQQTSLTLPRISSRARDLPTLATQDSNRATTSIILASPPTTRSTTIPLLASLDTHRTTIQGMSKDIQQLLHDMLSLDLVTTLTCTQLQVTKSCKSKYNLC